MFYRRRLRFHYLARPKIRADMKKENLYKLAHLRSPFTKRQTYFQQKWKAKQVSRAYHGENIKEQHWERLFSRISPAVVPMDPKYLAEHDGSEHARGRGSGLLGAPDLPQRSERKQQIPYMNMTYDVAERRLDQAVFRALFASSARQARQFCVHGHVKVNGKEMRFPGYMLNPGDMFQVEPEMAMYGLGALKASSKSPQAAGDGPPPPTRTGLLRKLGVLPPREGATTKSASASTEPTLSERSAAVEAAEDAEADIDTLLDEEANAMASLNLDAEADADADAESSDAALKATRKTLRELHLSTRTLLNNTQIKRSLSSKQKQALRAFSRELRASMSRAATLGAAGLEELQVTHAGLTQDIRGATTSPPASTSTPTPKSTSTSTPMYISAQHTPHLHDASDPDGVNIAALPPHIQTQVRAYDANPVSTTPKPYPTPWRPRNWLAPFAFIPRYLEVNQNICAAVYLRHPVAQPGLAEVPTPFSPETLQLAFNWYLRRR